MCVGVDLKHTISPSLFPILSQMREGGYYWHEYHHTAVSN